VLPLVLVYVNFLVIPFEERRLGDVFGDAYRDYGARVRRWL
jgi:protein-S-isoprenylcysteine O-methyltransferase Ste14